MKIVLTKEQVDEFYKICKIEHEPIILFCVKQKNLKDAIILACRSLDEFGKKSNHQKRIAKIILDNFSVILISNIENIENSKNFEELINLISAKRIHGIGALAVYDIALRIGFYLKIYPELIYLHAGSKTGAVKLIGKKINNRFITKEILTNTCQDLEQFTCANLEVFLCIYHKEKIITKIN